VTPIDNLIPSSAVRVTQQNYGNDPAHGDVHRSEGSLPWARQSPARPTCPWARMRWNGGQSRASPTSWHCGRRPPPSPLAWSHPERSLTAHIAACVRFLTPIFRSIAFKCTLTVASAMPSLCAITLLGAPLIRLRRISFSFAERPHPEDLMSSDAISAGLFL